MPLKIYQLHGGWRSDCPLTLPLFRLETAFDLFASEMPSFRTWNGLAFLFQLAGEATTFDNTRGVVSYRKERKSKAFGVVYTVQATAWRGETSPPVDQTSVSLVRECFEFSLRLGMARKELSDQRPFNDWFENVVARYLAQPPDPAIRLTDEQRMYYETSQQRSTQDRALLNKFRSIDKKQD